MAFHPERRHCYVLAYTQDADTLSMADDTNYSMIKKTRKAISEFLEHPIVPLQAGHQEVIGQCGPIATAIAMELARLLKIPSAINALDHNYLLHITKGVLTFSLAGYAKKEDVPKELLIPREKIFYHHKIQDQYPSPGCNWTSQKKSGQPLTAHLRSCKNI